ncbi:hypothetical protein ZWY2020_052655 [Hordeum vulgare]|nr:hypothetical protein ZWY2020_052655 [Hordeum vulgare]
MSHRLTGLLASAIAIERLPPRLAIKARRARSPATAKLPGAGTPPPTPSSPAASSFGLWSLSKVSTVTICKTNFGTLNPESITTLDADASSAEALLFRALET